MNLKNIKISFSLLVLFLLSSNLYANDLVDNANKAANFLRENVIHTDWEDFSEEEAVAAIRSISLALNHLELTKESIIAIKHIRVHASHSLNGKRDTENNAIDVSLALRAIKDLEYILREDPNGENASVLYSAGHIALHDIKDTMLAYEFWGQCAEMRHAGCMNTIAAESFTGLNGMPKDINKSLLWHQRVFDTGINYQCAGLFSANTLSNMAFFFPELKIKGDWEFWRNQRDLLLEELESIPDYEDLCGKTGLYLGDYVVHTALGNADKTTLDKAISATNEQRYIDLIESLRRDASATDILSTIRELTNNYEQCSFTFSVLLLAKYQNKTRMVELFEDHFYTLDKVACSTGLATIQRLRDQGRW